VFNDVMSRVAGRFRRVEPRRTARDLVLGLLSPVEHKNCWWLAEQAGHRGPQAMQRLLRTAVWDADAVRDDVREFVVGHLGHRDGVLIPDETGFVKKGELSIGVQRQYSGTAGRIENSQVAVFLSYASPRGRALIDRRPYLPRSWTDQPQRCAAAGIPAHVDFATKPELALDIIADAVAAGIAARWVASDELYGDNGAFRAGVAALGLGYVLAVSRDHLVPIDGGKVRVRADRLAAELPAASWHRYSAGTGAKGPRFYDWAWIEAATPPSPATACWCAAAATASWPSTGAGRPFPWPRPRWCEWPGCAGPSKKGSRPAKARSGSTTTRSGPGRPGTASSPWPCSRWRS
jgi:SRSO17 transposase